MSYELPFILHENQLADYLFGALSEESGYPIENVADYLDWTYWQATTGAEQKIYIDKTANGLVASDCLAILGHNFESGSLSSSTTVSVYESTTGFTTTTLLGSKVVDSDNPFYIDLTEGDDRYVTIIISPMNDPAYAAVVWLGMKMEMPVGPEFSFDPDMQEVMSERFVSYSGRLVSSAHKYTERMVECEFKRLSQTFIDSDLLPFLEEHYEKMKPFFFAPDPGKVFTDGDEVKLYYLTAPDNPRISLPVYNDEIGFRNWNMIAQGVRQSTFR